MNKLSRRHFLTGSAALAGSLALGACNNQQNVSANSSTSSLPYRPISQAEAAEKIPYYPPALTALRGDHDGSQIGAHAVALKGKKFTFPQGKASEEYDLIVIGAGISGLTSAYLYRKAKPDAKILILDNHDDFGGHAKRNEFTVNGKTLITYGGSESIDSPKYTYPKESLALLKELGIDYSKFNHYFQQDLYSKKWGLKSGIFFNQEAFGKTTLVLDEINAQNAAKLIAQFPMPDEDKRALIAMYTRPTDYLKGKTLLQKRQIAATTSYQDFLKNTVKLPEKALLYLQNLSSDYWGYAINAVSLAEAVENEYPATQKLGLNYKKNPKEPYIYHFPDGNSSIARLLVRKLIPTVASGNTMEDIVTAKFDYDQLDKPENSVRIRLNSTALLVENNDGGVAVAYLARGNGENLKLLQAKKCIFAGHATLASFIMPQMPAIQRTAMQTNIKTPMIYAKVALKNARAFKKLGIYSLYMPAAPYCLLQLDDPVNIGDYRHAETPDEPIVLHLSRIVTDLEGKTVRDMYQNGRRKLYGQTYEDLELQLREQLRPLYALAGENFDDAVAAITINRWSHGYSYEQALLWDSDQDVREATSAMQKPLGNIFMAGTDVAWKPYVQDAIAQAYRAVHEALA